MTGVWSFGEHFDGELPNWYLVVDDVRDALADCKGREFAPKYEDFYFVNLPLPRDFCLRCPRGTD